MSDHAQTAEHYLSRAPSGVGDDRKAAYALISIAASLRQIANLLTIEFDIGPEPSDEEMFADEIERMSED